MLLLATPGECVVAEVQAEVEAEDADQADLVAVQATPPAPAAVTVAIAVPPPRCAHCDELVWGGSAVMSQGLCGFCLKDPAVRLAQGIPVLDFHGPALPPEKPTRAVPGSEAKLCVLEARARQGQELWHVEDYRPQCREADALGVRGDWVGRRHEHGRRVDTRALGIDGDDGGDAAGAAGLGFADGLRMMTSGATG